MNDQSLHPFQSHLGRRDFLKASAALGGGLILGVTLPGCSKPASVAPPAGGSPNVWLRIGGDNSITMLVERSEMGQGVYTALPALMAEELEVPIGMIRIEAAPAGAAYINTFLGGQVTGGSTSVREAWQKLRMAGAQARTMLVEAAASEWGIAPSRCRAENGMILSDVGKKLTYGQVAEAAGKLPLPKNVKLRDANQFRIIGQPVKRTDTPSKVDGSAQFGLDVKLPNMLHASLAQSPVLGGAVKGFDAAAAEKMPGVRKVMQTSSGVVVVADHFWQARQARDALKIAWDPGPGAKLDNAVIRESLRKASPAAGQSARNDGDAAAALNSSPRKLEALYEVPLLAHATLEPMNCTADVRADGCDLYAPNQGQQLAQAAAAAAAGLKPEQVRVHTTLLGGGFGRRIEVDYIPAAVEASKAVGRPVKLIWTREDDTTHDYYRPPARNSVAGAFDGAAKLVAFKLHLTAPSITARLFPGAVEKSIDPFAIEGAKNYLYEVPNVSVDYLRQEIGINVGYWRSVSHVANCFTVESFMDELAVAARSDPLEFRRQLLAKQPRASAVLDEAARRAGWGQAPEGRHHGIALMEGYGTYLAQVAEVSVGKSGEVKVHRIVCAVDCGRMVNPAIVESQIEGGIIFGLTAALWGEVTIKAGQVQQTNFHQYRLMRLSEAPAIEVHLVPGDEAPGGVGEPATALVAPAVCNAIYAATGKRLRSLPVANQQGLKV